MGNGKALRKREAIFSDQACGELARDA